MGRILSAFRPLIKYHRDHKLLDWRIGLSFLGVAFMLSIIILPAWPWWLVYQFINY